MRKKRAKPQNNMVPIKGYPGLYKTNTPFPNARRMRKFRDELIKSASTPTMARLLGEALRDL